MVADLLTEFPRLRNLKGISFTELYNLRKKIKQLFTNEDIAEKWSEKMIYEDELCVICNTVSSEPSAFSPCGRGVSYCNTCMTEATQNREIPVEIVLDDGRIELQSMKIAGKNVQFARGEFIVYRNCIRMFEQRVYQLLDILRVLTKIGVMVFFRFLFK